MYRLIATVALAALVVAAAVEDDFAAFKAKYNRQYATELEEATALANFRENLARIAVLNERNPQATFGVNQFADISAKDFVARRRGVVPPATTPKFESPKHTLKAIPPIVNWVKAGGVTPIMNQGQCGSSWAFAAVYNIEGVNFATNKKLVELSVQEILDCDTLDQGCCGGFMTNAYQWLIDNQHGNIMTAKSWPYEGVVDNCSFANRVVGATITSYTSIKADEDVIAQYVATVGPVATAADADNWQFYQSGVMTDCSSSEIDHGTTIVGYNDKANPPYWMLKNQWGTDWGMEGYIYISKGNNTCGISEYATTAFVKKP